MRSISYGVGASLTARLVKNPPAMQEAPVRPLGQEGPAFFSFPVAQLVNNLPAMRETWVWSLCWDDPLEKVKATPFSIPAWRIPGTVQSLGHKKLDMTEWLSLSLLQNAQAFWQLEKNQRWARWSSSSATCCLSTHRHERKCLWCHGELQSPTPQNPHPSLAAGLRVRPCYSGKLAWSATP